MGAAIPRRELDEAIETLGLVSDVGEDVSVLYIEDDAGFADLVSTFLEREREHFTVATETDPHSGLEHVAEFGADCIVCDYDMPEMDGLAVLEAVRERHSDVPFILFTGKGSEEIASEAISRGVTEYLQKGSSTDQYSVLANRIEQAVARYRAEQQMLRGFHALETAHEGISLLNGDGEFIYVNEAYAGITGYDGEELLGEHWRTLFRDEDVERAYSEMLPQARAGGWTGETVFVRKDGEPITVDHTLAYAGENTMICTIVESNGAEEIRRELSLKERAMDEAPVGITISDASREDNPITYANDGFVELTGYPRREVVGRNCRFLQGAETREAPVAQLREAIVAREPATVELRNYRKSGEPFWNRVSVAPLRDEAGHVTHFVGFQQDVTERYEVENAREQLMEEYRALGRIIAHDLRSPMTGVREWLRLALETEDVSHVEKALPALERVEELTDDLAEMMQSSDIADGRREEIDVGDLAEATWKAIGRDGGSLEVRGSPRMVGDRKAVGRVLDNLLRNAVEHGGDDVRVQVGELETGIYVEDDGPGIPESHRDRVFEPGFTTKESGESAGLGTTSARQIASAHGWRIAVADAEELDGGRFEITDGSSAR